MDVIEALKTFGPVLGVLVLSAPAVWRVLLAKDREIKRLNERRIEEQAHYAERLFTVMSRAQENEKLIAKLIAELRKGHR